MNIKDDVKISKNSKFSCIDDAISNLEDTAYRFKTLLDELAGEEPIQPDERIRTVSFLSTYNIAAPRINEASDKLNSFLETLRSMLV